MACDENGDPTLAIYNEIVNRCNGVECRCESDCMSNTCYTPVQGKTGTCIEKRRSKFECNETREICLSSTLIPTYLAFIQTTNLCLNVSCTYNEQCHSGYCDQSLSLCAPAKLTTCNTTQLLGRYNERKWVANESTVNRCMGVPCQCDYQCQEGTYCNQVSEKCTEGDRKTLRCNETISLCEEREDTIMTYFTTNKCSGVSCFCDTDCHSGYCSQQSFLCEDPSQERTCNSLEVFCNKSQSNRCLGISCFCDNDCQSGYCNEHGKCASSDEFSDCEKRVRACKTPGEIRHLKNRCKGIYCNCDEECQSGFCEQIVSPYQKSMYGQCMVRTKACNSTVRQICEDGYG
ncbi:hypothetical protein FGO68_gene3061 [Halteria grandinella]|uniref:Uncharacterized protein n=1 Tax=Halteria grandinella TaxID=5974 RepID=A0A8J8P1L8_HALGN|nr:hypothetical protein FGO68_gene3061 [Halteria grandinella]